SAAVLLNSHVAATLCYRKDNFMRRPVISTFALPPFLRRVALLLPLSLALASCGSTLDAPDQALQAAELAITRAEQVRVADFATPELNQAREKLTAARSAVEQEDMPFAKRLADESRVSAELALAKTEMRKAQAVNVEMQNSIDTLKQ